MPSPSPSFALVSLILDPRPPVQNRFGTTNHNPPLDPEIQKAHDTAVRSGQLTYKDPKTGYTVMTEPFLRQRGYCCQSGCRHCPYGYHPTK